MRSARFNADGTCLVASVESDFYVYKTNPFKQLICIQSPFKDLKSAGIVDRSNVVLLHPVNEEKLGLYDMETGQLASIALGMTIKDAFVSKQLVLAVFDTCVFVIDIHTHSRLARIELGQQKVGIEGSVPVCLYENTIAVPYAKKGTILIATADNGNLARKTVNVHKSSISCMAMNRNFLASSSTTGTLIRCVDLLSLQVLTFRRGIDQTKLWSLALSPSNKLAALSANGTLHVFDLTVRETSKLKRQFVRDGRHLGHIQTLSKDPASLAWVSETEILVARASEMLCESYLFGETLERGPRYALYNHA